MATKRVPAKNAKQVIERDLESCARCGVHGGNIHHRQMRSQAPKSTVHNVENLILLCGSGTTGCHGYVHANPEEAYESGYLVHSWDKPEKVPVEYIWDGWFYLKPDGTRSKR